MTLLLDLGNSRLKVARALPGGGIERLGEAVHRGRGPAAALAEVLAGEAPDTEAWCANTAGAAAGAALKAALNGHGIDAPVFLRARAEGWGVRCAYVEPARLGADRWAALLGARGLADGPCLVVDAGSALTIDALAADGVHLGGWILPGLDLMIEALEIRTGDLGELRRASAGSLPAEFPADTGPAMAGGAELAAEGAVRLARARLEARAGAPARLLLAGGDAGRLLAVLPDGEFQPDLVLYGLARAAAAAP